MDFISILGAILTSLSCDFLTCFRHSLENVDFVNIFVYLQEYNVFHGSEGLNIAVFLTFFEAFLGKDYGIDFSLISGAIWVHVFDLLVSFFYAFQAKFFC